MLFLIIFDTQSGKAWSNILPVTHSVLNPTPWPITQYTHCSSLNITWWLWIILRHAENWQMCWPESHFQFHLRPFKSAAPETSPVIRFLIHIYPNAHGSTNQSTRWRNSPPAELKLTDQSDWLPNVDIFSESGTWCYVETTEQNKARNNTIHILQYWLRTYKHRILHQRCITSASLYWFILLTQR